MYVRVYILYVRMCVYCIECVCICNYTKMCILPNYYIIINFSNFRMKVSFVLSTQ